MCSASNKMHLPAYLLAAFMTVTSCPAMAESGVVSAVGTGRDSADAISNLLKSTVGKHFREYPPQLIRSVLQAEILPNASSFVQSYKILEGGRGGAVSLSASVDLDVINGLLTFSPKALGETEGGKALILVRGPKLPDSALAGMKPGAQVPDPFQALATGARERLTRRDFTDVTLTSADMQAVGAGEDLASPELLRGMGTKAGARVVMGITGRFEYYENENSHNKDERLVISATLVDVKAGSVIARGSVNVVSPKSRREQYIADLQRSIVEEGKDLFQDVLVAAGRRLVKTEAHTDFSVIRVQFPSNNGLVQRFRALLESVPGVRSVAEYSVRRGKFDLAIRPALTEATLAKAVAGLQSPDILISVYQALGSEAEGSTQPPLLTVKLAPKETGAAGQTEGAPANAKR